MKRHNAFTMIELIFVIVIMAFIGTYGVEFMANAYRGFVDASVYNRMQAQSQAAVTQIAARLQYRIRDSVIVRPSVGAATFQSLTNASANDHVLEWVGYDIDGWRGTWNAGANMNLPNWSGFIDVDDPAAGITLLSTPNSPVTDINQTIGALSNGSATVNNAALFFIGANTHVNNYGWGGAAVVGQTEVAHPINMTVANRFAPNGGTFQNVDVFEYYQLAWSAYAVVHDIANSRLLLRYNYQPWNGNYNASESILMENVEQFRFQAQGEMIWIQVCTKDQNFKDSDDGNYSICKEKVIF